MADLHEKTAGADRAKSNPNAAPKAPKSPWRESIEQTVLRDQADAEAQKQGLADLARSGLSLADAIDMEIRFLRPSEARQEGLGDCYAYHIPNIHPYGKEAGIGDRCGTSRRVNKPALWDVPTDKGGMGKEGKDWRYKRPSNAALSLYFHPKGVKQGEEWTPWPEILTPQARPGRKGKPPTLPMIFITEGEKKAAKACSMGIPCIAISGVDTFASKARDWALLPDFELLNLIGRPVALIYDSDHEDNIKIREAKLRFLNRLIDKGGAIVSWAVCPAGPEGEKQGLDELLAAGGREAWKALQARLVQHHHALLRLNKRLAYIWASKAYYDFHSGAWLKPAELYNAHRKEKITTWIDGKIKLASLGETWMSWLARQEADYADCAPGKPPIFLDPDTDKTIANTWAPPQLIPHRNDKLVGLFYRLFNHLTPDLTPDERRKLLAWHFAPLRFAGMKLHAAAIFYGPNEDMGKSTLGRIIRDAHGPGGKVMTMKAMEDNHNAQLANATFAQHDEAVDSRGRNGRANKAEMKRTITAEKTIINPKGINAYESANHCNYFFSFNALPDNWLDERDTRYWVSKTGETPLDKPFFKELYAAITDKSLTKALWWHLLADPGIWHLNAPEPPKTREALREAVSQAWPDLDEAWDEGQQDPANIHPELLRLLAEGRDLADGEAPPPLLFRFNPGDRAEMTASKRELIKTAMRFDKLALFDYMDACATDPDAPRYEAPLLTAQEAANIANDHPLADKEKPATARSMGLLMGKGVCPKFKIKVDNQVNTYYLTLHAPAAMPANADPYHKIEALRLREWIGRLKEGKPNTEAPATGQTSLRAAVRDACAGFSPAQRELGPNAADLREIIRKMPPTP